MVNTKLDGVKVLFFVIFACKSVDPAPEDLDGLIHYFWDNFDETDATIQMGIVNFHNQIEGDKLTEIIDGSVTKLNEEQTSMVGKPDSQTEQLSGVFFANVVNCPLASIEKNIYALNQEELHPDTYDEYSRIHTSDLNAYEAREESTISWETNYSISGFGYAYEAQINGTLRYVTTQQESPFGPVLLSRSVLNAPAYFDEDSDRRGMFQDFQMEMYYERSPGESIHLYAIWREMVMAGSIDFSSESSQRLVLDGLVEWDVDMENSCQ